MSQNQLFPNLPRRWRRVAEQAWTKGEDALGYFEAKISNPENLTQLSSKSQQFLQKVRERARTDNTLPLSAKEVRAASGQALIESVIIHAREDDRLISGRSRLKLLSIKPDVGLVNIDGRAYPAELTKRTSRSYISNTDVDAVMMLDLALFTPGRGQAEHLAHVHCHGAVAQLSAMNGRAGSIRKQVSPKRKPVNGLGDDVVTVSHKGTGNPPTLTDEDVAGLGWYVSKLTCGASTMYLSKKGQKSEKSHTDWSFIGALRQLEFWSYVDVLNACWAHGEVGRSIRTYWRKSLIERLDLGQIPKRREIDFEKRQHQWARVWADLGNGFPAIDPNSITATSRGKL